MELALEEEGSGESPPVPLETTPINVAVPSAQAPDAAESATDSSDNVETTKVVDAPEQDSRGTKRKEPVAGDDGASSSQRKRRVIRPEASSTEPAGGYGSQAAGEENAPHADVEKDVTKSPPHM